jgi:hypothetical protein
MKAFVLVIFICLEVFSANGQGCTKGNCYNGFGSYKYGNGSRYTGEFKAGKKHGKGIYYYANQNKYMGEWLNDLRQGEGKLSFANGDVYSGNFGSDRIEGQGSMDFKSGDRYTGTWKAGKPYGKGSYYFATGERYEGEFVNARFEGEGSLYFKTGSFYKGGWKQSKKEGYGEFKDISGKIIAAQWKNDKLIRILDESSSEEVIDSLKSRQSEPNNSKETEPVASIEKIPVSNEVKKQEKVNDVAIQEKPVKRENITIPNSDESNIHLNGITLPNCNAVFCNKGKGIFTYGDGSKYIGDFENGEPSGTGVCYYVNGDRYEGMWKNHAPQGEGVMYFSSGLTYGAIWDHGKSVKELQRKKEFVFDENIPVDRSPEVKIWAVIIGIARYEHMPALKYSDDDAYKIYAFLKSPEGGALKDDQIRILIDEEASRINILQALNQTFMKADENDVIMMYFSGHGLEGTFIPIDYDGFSNLLKHDDVKEILKRSKAKHKVCYTDACNSGSLLAAKGPFTNSMLYFYEEFEKANGGTAFFMSSKSKEYSLEDGGLRQGIFSHFLIKGLKGMADENHNKIITLKELFHYVYTNVRQYTSNVQTPMIAGDYDENMPVGFVRD